LFKKVCIFVSSSTTKIGLTKQTAGMLKTFKYELLPTDLQKQQLAQIFGSCRFLYNLALETKIQSYQKGKNVSCFDLIKQIPELKKECSWLSVVPSQSLQASVSHLDNAFTNFFKGRAKFPNFKKKTAKQSFHIPQGIKVNFDKWTVFLPKLKNVVVCRDRKFEGEIRNATVSKTPAGKYFACILVETGIGKPLKKPVSESTAVGIDVGLKHFATLSDGTDEFPGRKIENPKYLFSSLKRLRVEQRKLDRKYKKGVKTIDGNARAEQSKNWHKQKLAVAKLHEKVSNQRKDFLHKTSTAIIKRYDNVCIENLNVAGMIQNKNLSRSIADVGWGMFETYLIYKADWQGKNILQIGRFEPSSKICSSCGTVNKELKLSDRTWQCSKCGINHDRDINASINIKTFGLRTQPFDAKTRQ
jgi:putative transposase